MTLDASIVIPTFERPEAIRATLETLARMAYPRDAWEIVVVDDGSSDTTMASLRSCIDALPVRVRLLQQSHRGPAAARNFGAREAVGRILVFIDNDILVSPDFLRRHVQLLRAYPRSWALGRILHPDDLRATPFGRYRDARWEEFHAALGAGTPVETTGMSAANLAVPAGDFRRLGGFDESFSIASCEDWELGFRARQSGRRILYDAGNVVIHNDWAVTLRSFCERQRLYSISDVLLYRKYGDASPRGPMIRDVTRGSVKNLVKRTLATGAGQAVVRGVCGLVERLAPDTPLSRRAYDAAVAIAIFRGVREGLLRYPASTATPGDSSSPSAVGVSK